jgi:carboxypeptidase T
MNITHAKYRKHIKKATTYFWGCFIESLHVFLYITLDYSCVFVHYHIILYRSMKTIVVLVFLFLFVGLIALGQQVNVYSRIKVFVENKPSLDRVWNAGIDFEGSSGKIGGWMEFVAGPTELKNLSSQGIPYQILVEDLTKEYQKQLSRAPSNALGFGFGSMGGFYTFDEVVQQLDSMRVLHPTLISAPKFYGVSITGRPIWVVMISDNPDVSEPNEPEVLYTALHHAREPEGMMSLLYYMWWLLENYGTNPEATYLVNNRQMWFIPVMNPDGYVYNQTTNPTGGGMWRKNRRNNGDGTFGVDPNRNYGTFEMWNAPNGGSSTSPGSDTYRGTTPFSEPENIAMDVFMRSHNVKTCLNYHTYGNYLIYPWGYLSRENGDSLIYRDWAYEMTFANHLTNGTDQQTVNYSTRGNSDDYMFGDTTKPITYTMTPEVGTTGFWPSTGEILPLAVGNLPQNKVLAYVAGQYSSLVQYQMYDSGNGNGFLDRGEKFSLVLSVKNRGLDTAWNVNIAVSASSPYVQFSSPSASLPSLNPQTTASVTLNGSVANNATVGIPFRLYVTISDPQGYLKNDTVNLFLGTPTLVFGDSASNGTGNWTTGQGWGVTSNAHTPPNAFTDSPSGNYAANTNNSLTTVSQLNLNGYQYAELAFWAKWATEPTWDFATVELSTNNGTSWTTLRSKLSHSGSGRSGSQQPTGTWGYESYTPGLTWVEQHIDVSAYVNRQVKLRFRLAADGADQRDGLYVDDIRLLGYVTNTDTIPPTVPLLVSPANGVTNQPIGMNFIWQSSPTTQYYTLQIATDSNFMTLVVNDSTLTDTVKLVALLSHNTTYYWRVSAKNGIGKSVYSLSRSLTTIIAPPLTPILIAPPNGSIVLPFDLVMRWHPSPTGTSYTLQLAYDSIFTSIVVDDSTLTDTSRTIQGLSNSTTYYWRVKAKNIGGSSSYSEIGNFTTLLVPPLAPHLVLPLNGAAHRQTSIGCVWNKSIGAETYHLQLGFDSLLTSLILDDSILVDTVRRIDSLLDDTTYYWRVHAKNSVGMSEWSSPVFQFSTGKTTTTLNVANRWNLISLPLHVEDGTKNELFPLALSEAFDYDRVIGYHARDTLHDGVGYWIRFPSSQSVEITGNPKDRDTLRVESGWNLLGSLSSTIPTTSIGQDLPGNIQSKFYAYENGYVLADSLLPGKGYWVKVGQQGKLYLNAPSSATTEKTSVEYSLNRISKITFSDRTGGKSTLYFATQSEIPSAEFSQYALPPLPPDGNFDVRFRSQRAVEMFSSEEYSSSGRLIELRTVEYPITVHWDLVQQDASRFALAYGSSSERTIVLGEHGSMELRDPEIHSLNLRRISALEPILKEYSLHQNYPNPFNPTTTIRYDLARDADVRLQLFNILGQVVRTLIAGVQEAGVRYVEFDASELPSGVYYYRFIARSADGTALFADMKKMIVIK